MPAPTTPRVVVVVGSDATAVGVEVARRRLAGDRVAGFIGTDHACGSAMGDEMLGGVDELVVLDGFMRYEDPDSGP